MCNPSRGEITRPEQRDLAEWTWAHSEHTSQNTRTTQDVRKAWCQLWKVRRSSQLVKDREKTGNTAKLQEKAQCIQVASSDLSCLRSHPAHWWFFISTSSDQQHLSLSLWKRLFKSLYLPFCSKLHNLNSYPFPATDTFLSGNFRGRGVSASARRWVHPACVLVICLEHRKILESDKCIWGTMNSDDAFYTSFI